jgi:bifunctional DNA-binding transcriptional regulator/antitoxin component of YhaV-PrlF toxin-antitoxin module
MSLNGSGAVTIPKSIRTAMGLRRGDQISPEIAACGAILIRPIPADPGRVRADQFASQVAAVEDKGQPGR